MEASSVNLPEGYTLDQPTQGLPDGYTIDQPPSALEAAGRGALRNFPLAQQAAAAAAPVNPFAEKKNYSDELQHLTEAAESSKAAHPFAYGAGAVAGTVAPLLIPGVGEALEAAPIAGNAAMNVVQSQSDTNLTKPTGTDALNAGIAGAIGGGLGAAGKALLPARGAAAQVASEGIESEAPLLDDIPYAQPKAAAVPKQAPGLTGPQEVGGLAVPDHRVAPDFKPSAERVYASNLAQGMGGTPRQLMKVFGKEDPVKALNEFGGWMETAGPKGSSLHSLMDRPGELLEKVDGLHESSGKVIGRVIDRVGESKTSELPGVWAELQEMENMTADPQTAARIGRLVKTAEGLEEKGISDFRSLQQLKEMAGEQIKKDPEMAKVYGSIADRMTRIINKYGETIEDPSLKTAYAKAKVDYHNSSRILPMLRYAEARELVGGPAGHHTLRGLLSSIFNIATSITGVPPAEQIAKNVMLKTAPVARNIANVRASIPTAATIRAGQNPKAVGAGALELANFLEAKFGQQEKRK